MHSFLSQVEQVTILNHSPTNTFLNHSPYKTYFVKQQKPSATNNRLCIGSPFFPNNSTSVQSDNIQTWLADIKYETCIFLLRTGFPLEGIKRLEYFSQFGRLMTLQAKNHTLVRSKYEVKTRNFGSIKSNLQAKKQ